MADQGVSEFVSRQLSEISHQLGQAASAIEALREDMRDESASSKRSREVMTNRLDNLAERTGSLERLTQSTKETLDKSVMPLVEEREEQKLRISGALKVWGLLLAIGTGISTVFWSRLLNLLLWVSGNGGEG